jgi:hypothetical protein
VAGQEQQEQRTVENQTTTPQLSNVISRPAAVEWFPDSVSPKIKTYSDYLMFVVVETLVNGGSQVIREIIFQFSFLFFLGIVPESFV